MASPPVAGCVANKYLVTCYNTLVPQVSHNIDPPTLSSRGNPVQGRRSITWRTPKRASRDSRAALLLAGGGQHLGRKSIYLLLAPVFRKGDISTLPVGPQPVLFGKRFARSIEVAEESVDVST